MNQNEEDDDDYCYTPKEEEDLLLVFMKEWPCEKGKYHRSEWKSIEKLYGKMESRMQWTRRVLDACPAFWRKIAIAMKGFEILCDAKTGQGLYIEDIKASETEPDQAFVTTASFNSRFVGTVYLHEVLRNPTIWGPLYSLRQRVHWDLDNTTQEYVKNYYSYFLDPNKPPDASLRHRLEYRFGARSWNNVPLEYNFVMRAVGRKYGLTAAPFVHIVETASGKLINTMAEMHTGCLLDELPFIKDAVEYGKFCGTHNSYNQRMANHTARTLEEHKIPPDAANLAAQFIGGMQSTEAVQAARARLALRKLQRLYPKRPAPTDSEPPARRPRTQDDHEDAEAL